MGWLWPPITPLELQEWSAFERVDGPILIHDRIEMSVGIAALVAAAPYTPKNKRVSLADYMPHWDAKTPRPGVQSAEEIMGQLKMLSAQKFDGPGEERQGEPLEEEEVVFYGDSTGDVHSEPTPRRRVEQK